MGKTKDSLIDIIESNNWNVAGNFVDGSIYKHMGLADIYYKMALLGGYDLEDQLNYPPEFKKKIRVTAIVNMAIEVKILHSNTGFALKKKHKEEYKQYAKLIDSIQAKLPMCYKISNQDGKEKIMIFEDNFRILLEMLFKINEKMKVPINEADMIFGSKEEYDPDELKEKIMQQIIDYG